MKTKNIYKRDLISPDEIFAYGTSTTRVVAFQDVEKKQVSTDEIKPRKLEMRVELDSFSPVYPHPVIGMHREKISSTAFDHQGDISKIQLRSFLDHKQTSENLIG